MAAIVERYDCISSSSQMSATWTPPKVPETLMPASTGGNDDAAILRLGSATGEGAGSLQEAWT